MCNIRSHFVTIDSTAVDGIMKEVCPESDVRNIEFNAENRETYWMNIFDFKRFHASKQKVFTGVIETDGVAMYVHDRQLKADSPIPFLLSILTKRGEKEAGPAAQQVQSNDFVVGADPGNTDTVTIAALERGGNGIEGNLRQKGMCLLRFSSAGCYRESG